MRWFILTLVLLLTAGCSPLGNGPTTLTREQLEQAAALHLPATAEVLETRYLSFQDSYLTAVLRLPSSDLPQFLADSGFSEPTPGLRAVTNGDLRGKDRQQTREEPVWNPDAASEVSGIEQTSEPLDGLYRKLMIDTGAAEPVIYLVAFTT